MTNTVTTYSKQYPEYITITCLEWKHLLDNDMHKDIIMNSLNFLVREARATIYAFVVMSNHLHLIWQCVGDHHRENVQRDFLRFTSQQIIKLLRNDHSPILTELEVDAKDRKHQVWERNSLSIPLWSTAVFNQKLEYIHLNPVRAGLCTYPEDYKYSSARFYLCNENNWSFLTHYNG